MAPRLAIDGSRIGLRSVDDSAAAAGSDSDCALLMSLILTSLTPC